MTATAALRLREALGNFVTGVTIITTRNDGGLQGLTANSFSSVSLDPPLVLFSLSRTADCFDAFEDTEFFAINVLRSDQEALSNRFATKDIDKWTGVDWRPGLGGCPLLDGAIATFECRVCGPPRGRRPRHLRGRSSRVRPVSGGCSARVLPRPIHRGRQLTRQNGVRVGFSSEISPRPPSREKHPP